MSTARPRKTVYLNDLPIGEASSWAEVAALLKANGILFAGKPGKAEGPSGFYVHGTTREHEALRPPAARRDKGGKS